MKCFYCKSKMEYDVFICPHCRRKIGGGAVLSYILSIISGLVFLVLLLVGLTILLFALLEPPTF